MIENELFAEQFEWQSDEKKRVRGVMGVDNVEARFCKNARTMYKAGCREVEVFDQISGERAKPKPKE
jgi:hypothetical protein